MRTSGTGCRGTEEGMSEMNGTIYNIMLNLVSNDTVAWAFIKLTSAYKYVGVFV
jgi:hypothetical protein